MGLFLDTCNIEDVKFFMKTGIIQGVTTNPTILFKNGVTGGIKSIKPVITKIAKLISPFPLSVEVITNDKREMMRQAVDFSGWAKNIVVKIPIHGPKGELDNLEVIHTLSAKHRIHINATTIMNSQQCYIAALAGASYVSIFGGRVNDMGYNCLEEIAKTRGLFDSFKIKAKLIVGSTREASNIIDWLSSGAHIVTVIPRLLRVMIIHPYTKETVKQFLDDAKR